MSNIVTFYSYKGGVGRSMAMVNIAVLLAKRGLKVLAVDWDLEAPGLERYFSYFKTNPSGSGLLNLLMEKHRDNDSDLEENFWRIDGEIEGKDFSLNFIPSGKETDSDYVAKLESLDWEKYFAEGGGDYIESLREKWRKTYDVTLIDSRTGLSDAGGICTIQLPDIVVAMFTANYQSLYGVRDIMRLAQAARDDLAYDRMHLDVVPLPARFGSRTEFRESQEWLSLFAEVLGEFYNDWLPTWLDPHRVVEVLKIPQVDFFSFGEKLAVVEQGTSDPDGMGFVYDRVASLLANNLQNAESVLKIDPSVERQVESRPTKSSADYEYDVYVSYRHQAVMNEWLREFVGQLQAWIGLEMGYEPKIFLDYSEVPQGDKWPVQISSSLLRAKLLLPVLTPAYFNSVWCLREWATFQEREQITRATGPLILPILIRGKEWMPEWAATRQFLDMSDLTLGASSFADKSRESLRAIKRVQQLAKQLADLLRQIPPFDTKWTVAEDSPRLKQLHDSDSPGRRFFEK